jgi:cystathionine gamma-synthase
VAGAPALTLEPDVYLLHLFSLVLNPHGRHYKELKAHAASHFEDFYFDEDAIFMERNSRDFRPRIYVIDTNTEAVCDFLRSRSVAGGYPNAAVKDVFYPKWSSAERYDRCRVKGHVDDEGTQRDGGYGGLFSLTFTSMAASRAFFDMLPAFKGPSLGTNFTLACPYTVLAHYAEMDWSLQFGVEEGLVRVSVGLEDTGLLLENFRIALEAAEAARS